MHALGVTVHLAAEKPACEGMLRISHGAYHAICFDRHEHGTRIRAVMGAHRAYHVVHNSCLHDYFPLSSATLLVQKTPPSFISPSPPLSLVFIEVEGHPVPRGTRPYRGDTLRAGRAACPSFWRGP